MKLHELHSIVPLKLKCCVVRYLSWLLARRLVLYFLAQIPHTLILRQEVFLLGHFFPIIPLVQGLPVKRGQHVMFVHSTEPQENNAWNKKGQSINVPSLHEERIPPHFRLPAHLESGK